MEIKFVKLHKDAVEPKQAYYADAGFDLTATSMELDYKTGCIVYGTGIAVEIPEGFVGLIFPRSSVYKTDMRLTNAVGVIDAGYRDEIKAVFKSTIPIVRPVKLWHRIRALFCRKLADRYDVIVDNNLHNNYEIGDRIGQLIIMPIPYVEYVEVDELSESERGKRGYGSTGR